MPDPDTENGDTEALAPGGVPAVDNVTVPVKPPNAVIVIVVPPPPPREIVTDDAFALSEKSEVALTVRVIEAV